MASSELDRFVQAVVDDHGIATGIKPLATHYDLVAYANIRGFSITLVEWGRHLAMDWLQSTDAELELLQLADPAHWSWAFRQLSRWRPLLMEGTLTEGLLGTANFASISESDDQNGLKGSDAVAQQEKRLTDAERDAALESFIAMLKSRPDLKQQVKFARDQAEVIELANAEGFPIDSLTLLRRWNKVSDFTKPTWFGWFDD